MGLSAEDVAHCAAIVLGPGVTGGALGNAIVSRVRGGTGLLVLGGEGLGGLCRLRGSAIDPLLPVAPPLPPAPQPEPPAPPPPVKKPDPAKPNGLPYLKRDGETNPGTLKFVLSMKTLEHTE